MRGAALVLVVGCASTAPPPISNRDVVEVAKPDPKPTRFIDRHLRVRAGEAATRTIWALSLEGQHATLVETEQQATRSVPLEQVDGDVTWTTTQTRSRTGPARTVGDHLALDLETDSDSLFLRCWHLSIVVAAAGALRVPTFGRAGDCSDPGVWSPATRTPVDALICGQGEGLDDGQVSGIDGRQGSLDETLWRFVPAPGVELVEVTDGCWDSVGLRLAK